MAAPASGCTAELDGRTQRLGQPTRTREQALGLPGHIRLLQVVDELYGGVALRLSYGLEDARLWDSPEIIVDGRTPSGRRHIEVDGAREPIGMSNAARAAIPRLVYRIDAERGAMGQQCRLAVAIERRQHLPKLTLVLRQLLCPLLMADLDRLCRGAVGEPRCLPIVMTAC